MELPLARGKNRRSLTTGSNSTVLSLILIDFRPMAHV